MPIRFRKDIFLLVADGITVIAAAYASLYVRFEGAVPTRYLEMLTPYLFFFLLIVRIGIFDAFHLYNRIWKYARMNDVLAITAATSVSSVVLAVADSWLMPTGLPRSFHILNWLFVLMGAGSSRLVLKNIRVARSPLVGEVSPKRILIVGAGDAGAMLTRDILNQGKNRIVGFIDDDPKKKGRELFGLRVWGGRLDIPAVSVQLKAAEIWIAMPSVPGEVVREIVEICRETTCRVRTLPSLIEIVDCQVSVRQLRDIRLEDLLRRAPVHVEKESVLQYLFDKTVLVTGAGGSIGSELCRQIATFHPERLLLLGKGENSIYNIHTELKRLYPDLILVPIIADVRDVERIQSVFQQWQPQVVFHAAAHKHVPLMELQPEEAIKNNVVGTWVLAQAASVHGVERFILISTDKAVKPSSVMGATKRAAEIVINALGRRVETKFAAVRFGNVLGSRGSVVPLFESQISAGGPITVTHPDMKRYFMTIPEAAELVLQAGSMAAVGGIFILDMGKPIRVVELAEDLVRLMGLEPYRDIAIEFTGVRPGEKINEELFYAEEEVTATSHPKILRAKAANVLDVKSEAFIAELVRCTTAKELLNLVCVYEGNGREERSEQEIAAFPPQAGECLGAAN